MDINAEVSIPHSLKQSHAATVLTHYVLALEGPYTIGEIVERTGMSPSVVTTVLTEMEDSGYVEETNKKGDTKYRIIPSSVTV